MACPAINQRARPYILLLSARLLGSCIIGSCIIGLYTPRLCSSAPSTCHSRHELLWHIHQPGHCGCHWHASALGPSLHSATKYI